MRAYVINIMVVLIIFPVILQTVINLIMLSIRGQELETSINTVKYRNKTIKYAKP